LALTAWIRIHRIHVRILGERAELRFRHMSLSVHQAWRIVE
jgi:hypothetical protein